MFLPQVHFLVSQAELVWSINREDQGTRFICLSAVGYEVVGLSDIQGMYTVDLVGSPFRSYQK